MEPGNFDLFAARLSAQVTRRRSLGLLGFAGILGVGLGLRESASAGNNHRKRRRKQRRRRSTSPCRQCLACEACVNDTCQPLDDGAVCAPGAICANGACGRTCTALGNTTCPEGTVCPLENTVCVERASLECGPTPCLTNLDCPANMVCIIVSRDCPGKRCAAVAPL